MTRPRSMTVLTAALLWLSIGVATAHAEEGLFTARILGGAVMVHPDLPYPGGVLSGSLDYGLKDRIGIVLGSALTLHRAYTSWVVGPGIKITPILGTWARLYLYVGPGLLLAYRRGVRDRVRPDFAVYGGLGFEYLVMWGFGFTIEATGTLPAGIGASARGLEPFEAAAIMLSAGLFMEL